MNNIEDLKKSALDFQSWIDNGFEELDETDTYTSDLFYAVATPKNILELIEELESLKARIDGGVRVAAKRTDWLGSEFTEFSNDRIDSVKNATLILDVGVEL